MKEKDLTILDAYNEVLDFPSKDDTITTQLHLYPSARKMKKIFNKIGSQLQYPKYLLHHLRLAFERTTPTKASAVLIPQTNEIESKHGTNQGDIVWMEMDDMSQKTEDIKERALPKSSSKPKSPTTKKKTKDKGNNDNMVTVEMHNNLKNTIKKMDDEITQFAKRYEEEQASIATEISRIVEALIAPIASENTKLKEELNDANLKIEQLRSQILDITTQNRNKIKETKN